MNMKVWDTIWIGDSAAVSSSEQPTILNVAQDLCGKCGWPAVEYAQVGLIDGPGNTLAGYAAAILALAELQKRGKTLVFCHTGGRALAVVLMYLEMHARRGWDVWLRVLNERVEGDLPVVHDAHRQAFNKLTSSDWRLLAGIIG